MGKGRITDALIERHRDINVMHNDWYEGVYDCVKDEQAELGVEVSRIYFSGFWSQGDGACFEGWINDWSTFMEKHRLKEKYPLWVKLAERGGLALRFQHRGYHYHSGCVEWDWTVEYFDSVSPTPEHEMILDIWHQWDKQIEEQTEDFQDDVQKILRAAMDDCYRRLEEEYDYLTSDEQVREALEANEIYDEDEEDDDAEPLDCDAEAEGELCPA